MTAIVRNNQFIFDGVHYFRGGAIAVQLGEYGRKKTPFLGVPSLEVVDANPDFDSNGRVTRLRTDELGLA